MDINTHHKQKGVFFMRRSFKQQLIQQSNDLLLNNHLEQSTSSLSSELSDEFNVNTLNRRIHSNGLLHRIKQQG
jgi:hypothetical protein